MKRIRMSRQHPWRADNPDAVIVDRKTRWGNPFRVGGEYVVVTDDGDPAIIAPDTRAEAAAAFQQWMFGQFDCRGHDDQRTWIREHMNALAGKDLACWCPLPEPDQFDWCHATSLLELANGETQ